MNLYRKIKGFICHLMLILGKVSYVTQARHANRKIGFETEVGFIKIPMTILGVWPFANNKKLAFYVTSVLCILSCLASIKSFFIDWKNEGIYQYLFVLFLFFTTIKTLMYRVYEGQLKEIFICMKVNWKRRRYLTDDNQKIMSDYVKKSRYIVIIWMATLGLGAMVVLPLPWITSSLMEKSLKLYVTMWYNPLVTDSPNFELLMTAQLIVGVYTLLIFFSLESCFFIITLHCCGQLKILFNKILKIDGRILHYNPIKRYHCSCIKCIVETHWKIIRFYKVFSKCFAPLLFLNTIVAMICGGAAVVMICKPMTSDNVLFTIISFIYWLLECIIGYLYCYVGEILIQESLNISNAVFNCKWYELLNSEAKSCLIIMIYCQNTQMKIQFGLFYSLSNELFKDLMLFAYSVFNVARSVRDKNY